MENTKRLVLAVPQIAAIISLLMPQTAYAAPPTPGKAVSSWVSLTIVAVLLVTVTWILAVGVFHVVRQLHWVPSAKTIKIRRIMQITFGSLFLMAGVMPFLALNYPFALLVTVVAVVAAGAVYNNQKTRRMRAESPAEKSL